MSNLTVIGGTYLERCHEPEYEELFGSGLRGACALSGNNFKIDFYSCIGEEDQASAEITCNTFDITPFFTTIKKTVLFDYYHPLSKPVAYSPVLNEAKTPLPEIQAENVLYYGMIEADVKLKSTYLVYDPQNGLPYSHVDCNTEHLALVLNKKEALLLSGLPATTELNEVGMRLLSKMNAEVVVIKNGPNGGLVLDKFGCNSFPVFDSSTVWPIGSGDIFSAAFTWQWCMKKVAPFEAAYMASRFTADYCGTQILPLSPEPSSSHIITKKKYKNKVYLAGPFFTVSERWLINEFKNALLDFGNEVFSPFHEVGGPVSGVNLTDEEIASRDLEALTETDTVLAIANGADVGTIFEIGFAKSKSKKVVVFVENINPNDLTMLIGSDCYLTNDFSSAVYKASW